MSSSDPHTTPLEGPSHYYMIIIPIYRWGTHAPEKCRWVLLAIVWSAPDTGPGTEQVLKTKQSETPLKEWSGQCNPTQGAAYSFLTCRVGIDVVGYTQEIQILEFIFTVSLGLLNRQKGREACVPSPFPFSERRDQLVASGE